MQVTDLNLKEFDYQTPEVLLLPVNLQYRKLFPPDLYQRIHQQLIADGTLQTVFCGMQNAEDFKEWSDYITKCPVVLYIIKPDRLIGFGWVAEREGVEGHRKASFGFGFFRHAWGTKLVRDLCFLSLRWWFDLDIEILYASSLKTNRLAVNFSRNFGFRKLCDLPKFFLQAGRLVDGTLICLPRDVFDPLYTAWRVKVDTPQVSGIKPNGGVHLTEREV